MITLTDFYKTKPINNSSLFLVELLPLVLRLDTEILKTKNQSFLHYLCNFGLENSYIQDEICTSNNYKDCLFLKFNTSDAKGMMIAKGSTEYTITDYLLQKKECIDFYECEGFSMFVITFDSLKRDYRNIINGKYSKITAKSKRIFEESRHRNPINQYLCRVIFREPSLLNSIKSEFNVDVVYELHPLFDKQEIYKGQNDKIDITELKIYFKNLNEYCTNKHKTVEA